MRNSMLLFIAIVFVSGCVSSKPLKRSAAIKVVTSPAGALAETEYGDSCYTPCSLRLLRNRGGEITLSKEGYEQQIHSIGSHIDKDYASGEVAINSVVYATDPDPITALFDALPLIVDPKATFKVLDEDRITVQLTPLEGYDPFDAEESDTSNLFVDEHGVILLPK